jgi:hypothetical protein
MAQKREEGLNGVGQLGIAGCLLAKQYADAGAIGKHWPRVSHELAALSDTNEGVAKVVDLVTEIGPYGALLLAVMPLIMQLAANHGMIKADNALGGDIVPPAVLEAQMKADIATMQAEALRQQQQALREMAEAQADYEAELSRMTVQGEATESVTT